MNERVNDRPRVEWQRDVQVFEHEGLVVTISCLPLRVPQYSYRVMQRSGAGPLIPSLRADWQGRDVPAVVRRGQAVAALITEAEDWIEAERARVLRELDEQRRERESGNGRFVGSASAKNPMRQGKTRRDRERRAERRAR